MRKVKHESLSPFQVPRTFDGKGEAKRKGLPARRIEI